MGDILRVFSGHAFCELAHRLDDRGGVFVLLTETSNGWPLLQPISPYRVHGYGTSGVIEEGRYRGLQIQHGVITNRYGQPVAYRIHDPSGRTFRDISARSVVRVYDPDYYSQHLGVPGLSHAIDTLKAAITSEDYEEQAFMLASSIGLVEYNEMGGPDLDDPAVALSGASDARGMSYEQIAGGTTRYYKSNSGSKVEQLDMSRPGAVWESFQDRMVRSALAGINWPYELTWKSSDINAGVVRLKIAQAMASVEARQQVMLPAVRRMINYALGKAIDNGYLKAFPEWYRWGFTMPRKLSVDAGRDAKQLREDYKMGVRNMTGILEEFGVGFEEHVGRRAYEEQYYRKVAEKYDIPVESLRSLGIDNTPVNPGKTEEK